MCLTGYRLRSFSIWRCCLQYVLISVVLSRTISAATTENYNFRIRNNVLPRPVRNLPPTTLPSNELHGTEEMWRQSLFEDDEIIGHAPWVEDKSGNGQNKRYKIEFLRNKPLSNFPSDEFNASEEIWKQSLVENEETIGDEPNLKESKGVRQSRKYEGNFYDKSETWTEKPERLEGEKGSYNKESWTEDTVHNKYEYGSHNSEPQIWTDKPDHNIQDVDTENEVNYEDEFSSGFFKGILGKIQKTMSEASKVNLSRNDLSTGDNDFDRIKCSDLDLNFSLECLKEKLVNFILYLTKQESIRIYDGIKLDRQPKTDASNLKRSIGTDFWSSVVGFFRSRILKVTVPDFGWGLLPSFVTTARLVRGENDSSRFEVGLEMPEDSEEVESETSEEGRGKKKYKKFKKAVMVALATKAAIIAKAVMIKVILLAKKALMLSVISLVVSAIIASKKKHSGKGDDHHRRLGATMNYFDVRHPEPFYTQGTVPLHGENVWPGYGNYYDRNSPGEEEYYKEGYSDNKLQSRTTKSPHDRITDIIDEGQGDWMGLTLPDNLE